MLPLLIVLVAGGAAPHHRLVKQPNLPRSSSSVSYALLEFAPASGAGMGAPCACTTPNGAKGETLTFTRASSGTCLKGNISTSIANGDLVTCSTDQARVMPGGAGTGGAGLLMESARTNSTLRSQEFDNAAWTKDQDSAPHAPVVTANAAVAPDGTTTAERIVFPATVGGEYSQAFGACPNAPSTASIFVKGVSGSGTMDLGIFEAGIGTTCVACAFNSSTWTRCSVSGAGDMDNIIIGSNAIYGGNCLGPASDVYLWGAQCEAGAYASSYIATTSAGVTRAADVASLSYTAAGGTFSAAATWVAPATIASNALLHLYKDANNSTKLSISSAKVRGTYRIGGSDATQDTAGSATASAANVTATYYDATNKAACLAGTCTTANASLTLPTGAQTLYLGADQAGANAVDGVIKKVCLDPVSTRCQ